MVLYNSSYLAPEYSRQPWYQFSLEIYWANIYIRNHSTNSENILSKTFTVLLIYEE